MVFLTGKADQYTGAVLFDDDCKNSFVKYIMSVLFSFVWVVGRTISGDGFSCSVFVRSVVWLLILKPKSAISLTVYIMYIFPLFLLFFKTKSTMLLLPVDD